MLGRMRFRVVASGLLLLGVVVVATPGSATAATQQAGAPAVFIGALPGSLGVLGPLTDRLVDRLEVGDDVAAAKFGTDRPIDDPVREQQLLDQVRAVAEPLGLDADDAVTVFRDQIEANKVVQRGLFARWTAHPDEAPTLRPDLATLRARLDRLTPAILDELVGTAVVRQAGVACRVQLQLAGRSAVTLRHLDALHRQALQTAVPTVCS
jgi:chorismate mutase